MWQINFKSINQKQKVDRSVAMVKNREIQQRQKNWGPKRKPFISEILRSLMVVGRRRGGKTRKGSKQGFPALFGPLGGMVVLLRDRIRSSSLGLLVGCRC